MFDIDYDKNNREIAVNMSLDKNHFSNNKDSKRISNNKHKEKEIQSKINNPTNSYNTNDN